MLSPSVNSRQLAVFFRCLAVCFNSGVDLVSSFALLSKQSQSPRLAQAAQRVSDLLRHGNSLSLAMQRQTCFSETQVSLVRAGERTGQLGSLFHHLALQAESRASSEGKVFSALWTPLVILGACLLLVLTVAPLMLGNVIGGLGLSPSDLPWPSRLLWSASQVLRNPLGWVVLIGLSSATLWALFQAWQNAAQRRRIYLILDRVPRLGPVLRLQASCQFLSVLRLSVQSGLTLYDAIQLAGQAAAHPMLTERTPTIRRQLMDGDDLDVALQATEFFGPNVIGSVRAAQESGGLARSLEHVQRLLQLDLEQQCETFQALLEPIAISLVGLIVGFCAIATLMPLARLIESL